MRRSKRRASPLQTLSVLAVSGLFFFIALAGLYKCFSKEPEVADTGLPAQSARDLQGEEGARAPAGREDRRALPLRRAEKALLHHPHRRTGRRERRQ